MLQPMSHTEIINYFNQRAQELKHLSKDANRPLESYKFKLEDLGKNTLGQCNYTWKTISLNTRNIHRMSEFEIKDTINHEIAHALVGVGFGHGRVWKEMAKLCGATPKATCMLESDGNLITEKRKGLKFKIFLRKPDGTLQFEMFSNKETSVHSYIPKRKRETLGKLVSMVNTDGIPKDTSEAVEVSKPVVADKPVAKPTKPASKLQSLGGVKMSVLPTKVAQEMYQNATSYTEFIAQFMATGKSEAYAIKNWKLCTKYFDI